MPNKQDKIVRNRDLINSFRPSIDAVDDDDNDGDDELGNEDSIAAAAVGLLASSLVAVFGSVVVSSLMSITKL